MVALRRHLEGLLTTENRAKSSLYYGKSCQITTFNVFLYWGLTPIAKKLVWFDWAMKRLLRNKANFDILGGFLSNGKG
jgi:hypothetical protein